MTSGISRSRTALRLIHMTDTASSARLVFASATTSPNLSISGSFWNCGAPPDSEIAVAIVSAPITTATSIAAKAASQSTAPGGPANVAMRWNTARVTTAMRAKFARLNAILTMRLAGSHEERHTRSGEDRQQVLVGRHEEQPDDGRDLAQRERMRLAAEVDEDDLRLGQEAGEREHRPRDVDRTRHRLEVAHVRGGTRSGPPQPAGS